MTESRIRPDRTTTGAGAYHRVVVLGAGYAGLPAAKRLARRVYPDEVSVTLVNATDRFLERPRLHQLAAGQDLPYLDLGRSLAGTGVEPRIGTVTGIDLAARTVTLRSTGAHGSPLGYDTLIYALGSRIDTGTVPGVAEHAYVLDNAPAARRLGERLTRSTAGRVVVCGGGPTGIEIATEIAESYPRLDVELVTRTAPGAWLSDRARVYLNSVLDKLGVTVRAGVHVTSVEADRIVLDDGGTVDHDACVWAGGFTVPRLAARAGLEVTDAGRAVVDATMRSLSHPDVYVIGDAAAVRGRWGTELAMGCRTGGFTGPTAADAVAAALTGPDAARPLRFRYFHECISLGRRRGLIQFLHADERPANRILTGKKAVYYKNATLNGARMLFRWPGPYGARRRHRTSTVR